MSHLQHSRAAASRGCTVAEAPGRAAHLGSPCGMMGNGRARERLEMAKDAVKAKEEQCRAALEGAKTVPQLLELASETANTIRGLLNKPPMIAGQVVNPADPNAASEAFRSLLVQTLDRVARMDAMKAHLFCSEWLWFRPLSDLDQRYPAPESPALRWPTPPGVSEEDLRRIALREFGGKAGQAIAELGHYSGPEPTRVRVDAMRCSRGDLLSLKKWVAAANEEYRYVLHAGEYRTYSQDPSDPDAQRLIDADFEEYLAWLRP